MTLVQVLRYLGLASAPSVSASGTWNEYFDTVIGSIRYSKSGAAYVSVPEAVPGTTASVAFPTPLTVVTTTVTVTGPKNGALVVATLPGIAVPIAILGAQCLADGVVTLQMVSVSAGAIVGATYAVSMIYGNP